MISLDFLFGVMVIKESTGSVIVLILGRIKVAGAGVISLDLLSGVLIMREATHSVIMLIFGRIKGCGCD